MTEQFDPLLDADDGDPGDAATPCPELAEDLYAYTRGELSGDQRAAVEAHLKGASCNRCREALREMEAFSRLLDRPQLQPREPSPNLFSRILATIAEEEDSTSLRVAAPAERELPARRSVDLPRRS